jgi:hypothetical protein
MNTLAAILILALLTISGAAYTDQVLTSDQRAVQSANWTRAFPAAFGGTIAMLSVDQVLRLISLPAVVAAFLIASQISGGLTARPTPAEMVSE